MRADPFGVVSSGRCPLGSSPIHSEDGCRSAASTMNSSYGGQLTNITVSVGCYRSPDGVVHFQLTSYGQVEAASCGHAGMAPIESRGECSLAARSLGVVSGMIQAEETPPLYASEPGADAPGGCSHDGHQVWMNSGFVLGYDGVDPRYRLICKPAGMPSRVFPS